MISKRAQYRIAGLSYLFIFITGFFANFMVLETLFADTELLVLQQNLVENKDIFQWGLVAFSLMVFFDLVLVWALFPLFTKRSMGYRIGTHVLRLLHALLFIWGLIPLFQLLNALPDGSDALGSYNLFLERWNWGLVFFGMHLLFLSGLLWKDAIPKWIALLIGIAGFGYLADSGAQLFYSDYDSIADVLALVVLLPGIAGELSFTIWLLWKGFRRVN